MNKCEYKDGKFKGCEKMVKSPIEGDGTHRYWAENKYNFCPFCGVYIRKPELGKPLIVKSGGTWVLYRNGIDYLCIKPFLYENMTEYQILIKSLSINYPEMSEIWKSFTGDNPDIKKLTDGIAKLRPMVIVKDNPNETEIHKLIFINDQGCITMPDISEYKVNWNFIVGLATAKELQEAEC